jgi:hypothetical protein
VLAGKDSRAAPSFRAGCFPPEQSSGIEHHLAVCHVHADDLEAIPEDPFTALLRQSGEPGPDAPRHRLIDYEVLEKIGSGGMGIVFKARQPGTKRLVAFKRLSMGPVAKPEHLARFRLEAQAVLEVARHRFVEKRAREFDFFAKCSKKLGMAQSDSKPARCLCGFPAFRAVR